MVFSLVSDYVHKPTRNINVFIFTYMKCAAGKWIHICKQVTNVVSDWEKLFIWLCVRIWTKQAQR